MIAAIELPRATSAPLVPGLPVLGSAIELLRDPYRWWAAQYRRFGPVFRLRIPTGGMWTALAGRPRNATVRAGAAGARVIALPRVSFQRLLEDPVIGADIAALAATRTANA